jgi:type VI secretion system protein VasD
LFEESKERLGADLLAEHRLRELTPGLNRTETFELAPEVKYIGLLGEFIQYENAQARVVFAIEPNRKTKKIIWINKTKLKVGDGDKPGDI